MFVQLAQRPSIEAVTAHLFWWPPAKRLAFLIDLSNRMETEDREVGWRLSLLHFHCSLGAT